MNPRFLPAGDGGIVVELGDAIDPELNARVRALDDALRAEPFSGYEEAIPTYRSLLVLYRPDSGGFDVAARHVRKLMKTLDTAELPSPPIRRVPTVYDGEDLEDVARETGMTIEDVIRTHSAMEYRVYVVGFVPGFAYMGLTDPALDVPRRSTPRTHVPAGSVAIAMRQTAIYPLEVPGGWNLIGRAEYRVLFDASAPDPSLFAPGDRVKFVPVEALDPRPITPEPSAPSTEAPVVEVEDGGLLTTVQDRGRFGYQRVGVPVAGAMDSRALHDANRLVGNDTGAAVLECTITGPTLRCLRPVVLSISGADLGAVVERRDLGRWTPPRDSAFRLRPGNVLRFEGGGRGARAYIGFAGGLDVPVVLGSRSTYLRAALGGYDGRALTTGDALAVLPRAQRELAAPLGSLAVNGDDDPVVRFVWGPQDDFFTDDARATLESSTYTVGASSDRMGYRLEGKRLSHRGAKQIISDANAPGSIQVPPDGLPIVMLADRGTTGGYPKIATLVRADLRKLAQLEPGDSVCFRAV